MGRDFFVVITGKEAIGFQFPKLLCQAWFRNVADMPAKFPEAVYIPKGDIIDGFNLPFTAQDFCMVETVLQRSTANVLFFIIRHSFPAQYNTSFFKNQCTVLE